MKNKCCERPKFMEEINVHSHDCPKRHDKKYNKIKEAKRIANVYLKDPRYKDPYELAILISNRIEYYSDRWSNDGIRFEAIRIMLNECEKRWEKRKVIFNA